MARPFYEQPGLNVEVYTERTAAGSKAALGGDVAFYAKHGLETGGPVLELGCGNGRVALPMARAGLDVTGLDLSQPMLDAAAEMLAAEPLEVQRRLALVHGDMRGFDLGRQFGCAIIAFRSFQMLLTPGDEQACLAAVRRHLRPGGRLVVDVFDPRLDLLEPGEVGSPAIPRRETPVFDPLTGNKVEVEVTRRTNDCVSQVLEEIWRFTESGPHGQTVRVEEEVLRMRWIYRWEMRYLLEKQGFEVVAEHSDFEGSPPAYGKEQIWVARAV